MSETKPIPCPFCGMELKENMRGLYEDCNKECIMYCFELHPQDVPLWNARKPIERIVERLEEKTKKAMHNSEKAAELGEAYEKHMIFNGAKGTAFEEAIEIVKEEGGLC